MYRISGLADARKEKGFTQEQLAELTGIHRVTIARYETGEISPTARNLVKIAAVLNVPVDALIRQEAG